MASLVKGVYVQQSDRKNRRRGSQALASKWWESFHFTLKEALYDEKDESIYGAIYQLNPSAMASQSPKFVMAFRGTQKNKEDLKLDLKIINNKLSEEPRFKHALKSVKHLITSSGGAKPWLTGHSLGAAIALLVGKELGKDNCMLETYLFNPPHISIPTNAFIKDEKVQQVINAEKIARRVVVTSTKAAMSAFIEPGFDVLRRRVDPFEAIREWVPHLYLNPADPICSEYIEYFKIRESKRTHGLAMVERIANRVLIFPLLERTEPMHLLASAELNINEDRSKHHSLRQWYDIDLRCKTVVYRYKHPPLSITSSSSS